MSDWRSSCSTNQAAIQRCCSAGFRFDFGLCQLGLPEFANQRDLAFDGAEREAELGSGLWSRVTGENTQRNLPQAVVVERREQALQLIVKLHDQFWGRLGAGDVVKAVVSGLIVRSKSKDRFAADDSAASFRALRVTPLIECLLPSEVPQQLREILATQVFTESPVTGGLAEFVEDRECDVFLIRGSAFVRPQLSAGFADQRLAAELPQIRRGLFVAVTEFQVQPSHRCVVVEHA